MFAFFGGGNGIAGLLSDGRIPGGIILDGGISVGTGVYTDVPPFSVVFGQLKLQAILGNEIDDDDILLINQGQALPSDSFTRCITITRFGTLGGHDYKEPMVVLADNTLSTASLQTWVKGGTTQVRVDGDGLAIHDKFKTGASIVHILGAYSGNAVPVYDESGTLLGYMPLYA